MNHYIRIDYSLEPYNSDAADLLAAFLADIGFETFEEKEGGMSAFVQEENYDEAAMLDILRDFPMDVKINWEKERIQQIDWNEEWEKKYFKPLLLGDGKCVVHSTFHKDYPPAEIDIVIDPKMAFGTGHHTTTSLMVKNLLETDLKGKKVIDMGTGTGILAIIAKKLGAGETIGIEIDPFAYENALENAAMNGSEIILKQGDASLLEGEEEADIFLANINRNVLLADMDRYVRSLKKQGLLIISGFYDKDIELLKMSLEANGMEISDIITGEEDWTSIRSRKK